MGLQAVRGLEMADDFIKNIQWCCKRCDGNAGGPLKQMKNQQVRARLKVILKKEIEREHGEHS